jgi:hypothetical protein
MLSQFVIKKLEQGDVFTFRKVKKVMVESPEYEEEEEYEEEDESDGYGWREKIIEKDELERKEKRDKLIRSCRCYTYLRDSPNLFTKEERNTLLDPFIEDLSEESFQRLLNKCKMFDTQLKVKQINEDIEAKTSSIIETQECILIEEIYDHIYFKLEKVRIKKELLKKKKTKRKSESTRSKKNVMKFLRWIINFILTKGVGKYSESRNQSYYTSLNEQRLMKALNGETHTNKEE